MKKLLIAFLLPVFILMSVGVKTGRLYCDGKLNKTGLTVNACCPIKSCCKVEYDLYKISSEFEQEQNLILKTDFVTLPVLLFYKNNQIVFSSLHRYTHQESGNLSPPLSVSRNVLYSVFII